MMAHTDTTKVLEACVAQTQSLSDLVDYATHGVVSKTLVDKPSGTVTIFSFDKGQGLSEHTSPYDALVQIVQGKATLIIGGNAVEANEREVVIMPAHVPHAVQATERFKMLLTLIR
jgi:quercetin dioxygenase-like cupin family protein